MGLSGGHIGFSDLTVERLTVGCMPLAIAAAIGRGWAGRVLSSIGISCLLVWCVEEWAGPASMEGLGVVGLWGQWG